ncbi:hypothetical protein RB594_001160 [Gaeumannomyces avenae]
MAQGADDPTQVPDAEVGERSPLLAPPGDSVTDGAAMATTAFRATSQRLYASHFLSTWNSRVFEFGSVLYLAALFPGTLLPLSIYALARGIAAILFAPAVGHFVDRAARLRVVRLSIASERLAVASSCAIFYILGSRATDLNTSARHGLLALLCLLACVEKLSAVMNFIAVERDWVPVIAGTSVETKLVLNSRMRRIDIFCKLAGPVFIAFIDGASTRAAIVANFAMNLVSIPVEYLNISKVYYEVPNLQIPKIIHSPPADVLGPVDENPAPERSLRKAQVAVRKSVQDFSFYLSHPAFLPSFAQSTAYFTVLSFSGRMIAYLLSSGFTSTAIGTSRAASVAFEFCATWAAPWLAHRIGPVRAGLWFVSWQLGWLILGVTGFWLLAGLRSSCAPVASATALVISTILSRIGIIGFDLCTQTVVQEEVEEEHRGVFSSVESAFNSGFEILSYVATMVFSRPDQFRWPALFSAIGIAFAWALQATFVRRRRGHLLHLNLAAMMEKRPSRSHASSLERENQALLGISGRGGSRGDGTSPTRD